MRLGAALALFAAIGFAEPIAWRSSEGDRWPAAVWDWLESNRPGDTKSWEKLNDSRQRELLDEAELALRKKADEASPGAKKPPPVPGPAKIDGAAWRFESGPRAGNEGAAAGGSAKFDVYGPPDPRAGASVHFGSNTGDPSSPPPRPVVVLLPPPPGRPYAPAPPPVGPVAAPVVDRARSFLPPGTPVPDAGVEKAAMRLLAIAGMGPSAPSTGFSPNIKIGSKSMIGGTYSLDAYGAKLSFEEGARVGLSGASPEGRAKVERDGFRFEAGHSGAGAGAVQLGGGYGADGTSVLLKVLPGAKQASAGFEQALGNGWAVATNFQYGDGQTVAFVTLKALSSAVF